MPVARRLRGTGTRTSWRPARVIARPCRGAVLPLLPRSARRPMPGRQPGQYPEPATRRRRRPPRTPGSQRIIGAHRRPVPRVVLPLLPRSARRPMPGRQPGWYPEPATRRRGRRPPRTPGSLRIVGAHRRDGLLAGVEDHRRRQGRRGHGPQGRRGWHNRRWPRCLPGPVRAGPGRKRGTAAGRDAAARPRRRGGKEGEDRAGRPPSARFRVVARIRRPAGRPAGDGHIVCRHPGGMSGPWD